MIPVPGVARLKARRRGSLLLVSARERDTVQAADLRFQVERASIAHELRHVCASLLIASGASDVQAAHQMGHSRIETTRNIYGHLFAQDRASLLEALNQAAGRLCAYENHGDGDAETAPLSTPQPYKL
jgi:integrase